MTIREGDELVVLRIDRLARSIRDVLNIVHELAAKGASLRVLEPEVVSTGGALGKITIAVLGMAADLELNFIQDRQRAGIDAARAKGIYKGRRNSLPVDARPRPRLDRRHRRSSGAPGPARGATTDR